MKFPNPNYHTMLQNCRLVYPNTIDVSLSVSTAGCHGHDTLSMGDNTMPRLDIGPEKLQMLTSGGAGTFATYLSHI